MPQKPLDERKKHTDAAWQELKAFCKDNGISINGFGVEKREGLTWKDIEVGNRGIHTAYMPMDQGSLFGASEEKFGEILERMDKDAQLYGAVPVKSDPAELRERVDRVNRLFSKILNRSPNSGVALGIKAAERRVEFLEEGGQQNDNERLEANRAKFDKIVDKLKAAYEKGHKDWIRPGPGSIASDAKAKREGPDKEQERQ